MSWYRFLSFCLAIASFSDAQSAEQILLNQTQLLLAQQSSIPQQQFQQGPAEAGAPNQVPLLVQAAPAPQAPQDAFIAAQAPLAAAPVLPVAQPQMPEGCQPAPAVPQNYPQIPQAAPSAAPLAPWAPAAAPNTAAPNVAAAPAPVPAPQPQSFAPAPSPAPQQQQQFAAGAPAFLPPGAVPTPFAQIGETQPFNPAAGSTGVKVPPPTLPKPTAAPNVSPLAPWAPNAGPPAQPSSVAPNLPSGPSGVAPGPGGPPIGKSSVAGSLAPNRGKGQLNQQAMPGTRIPVCTACQAAVR